MAKTRIDHKILLAALTYPTAGLRHPDIDRAEMELYGRIRPPAGWIPANVDDIEWARKRGIPAELIKVFEDGWPNETTEIGPWSRLWDLTSMRREMESRPDYLEHGFLLIGSALNGDRIVMDLQHHRGAIGYVEFSESLQKSVNLRELFFEVSPSLGAFALGVVKDALPIDWFATWSEDNEKGSWFEDIDD